MLAIFHTLVLAIAMILGHTGGIVHHPVVPIAHSYDDNGGSMPG
jgi:hypothetical protein